MKDKSRSLAADAKKFLLLDFWLNLEFTLKRQLTKIEILSRFYTLSVILNSSGVPSLNSRGGCKTQNLKLKTEILKLTCFEGGGVTEK